MKYWRYNDYGIGLEDTIDQLISDGKEIQCVTILEYATHHHVSGQMQMFPIKALIIYK